MKPLPRVLCGGWKNSHGQHIRCVMPIIQTGEPGGEERYGLCANCLEWGKRAAERKWQREGRELLEQRRRGYGPGTEGEDAFRGFRG